MRSNSDGGREGLGSHAQLRCPLSRDMPHRLSGLDVAQDRPKEPPPIASWSSRTSADREFT